MDLLSIVVVAAVFDLSTTEVLCAELKIVNIEKSGSRIEFFLYIAVVLIAKRDCLCKIYAISLYYKIFQTCFPYKRSNQKHVNSPAVTLLLISCDDT